MAQVVEATQTGTYVNYQETELPAMAVPRMQVGKTFTLRLDPASPEHPML